MYAQDAVNALPAGQTSDPSTAYQRCLLDPWNYQSPIPSGFPVNSLVQKYTYRVPFSIQATNLMVGGMSFTLTTAGSPVALYFNPNSFDLANMFQVSITGTAPGPAASALFTWWTGVIAPRNFTNFSSWRLVAAGCRFIYSAAPLYAKGLIYTCDSNARSNTEFGTGTTGYGNFMSSPRVKIVPMAQTGEVFRTTYTPLDGECLNFKSTSGQPNVPSEQDWSSFIVISDYDAANGVGGLFDISVVYELIPTSANEPIIATTYNPGGAESLAIDASRRASNMKSTWMNTAKRFSGGGSFYGDLYNRFASLL